MAYFLPIKGKLYKALSAAGTTDPGVISGIKFMTIIPNAIAGVLAIVTMLAYPLTKKKVADIQAQLKARAAAN